MGHVDAAKLFGIFDLTVVQKDYLRTAYVLQRANGYVNARGRESQAFKLCMRRLTRFGLAHERYSGVFDLTSVGLEFGALLTARKIAP